MAGTIRSMKQAIDEMSNIFHLPQLETKASKAAPQSTPDVLDPPDLKVALKRQREEHQHLLAESYASVMDLTKQVTTNRNPPNF